MACLCFSAFWQLLNWTLWPKNSNLLPSHRYVKFYHRETHRSLIIIMICFWYFSFHKQGIIFNYYIDTDEIPGFFCLLKIVRIFITCSEDTIFIFHVWGYCCRHGYYHDEPIIQETFLLRHTFAVNRIFLFFVRILTFWNRKYKYYCLYFSFITLHPSLITFL